MCVCACWWKKKKFPTNQKRHKRKNAFSCHCNSCSHNLIWFAYWCNTNPIRGTFVLAQRQHEKKLCLIHCTDDDVSSSTARRVKNGKISMFICKVHWTDAQNKIEIAFVQIGFFFKSLCYFCFSLYLVNTNRWRSSWWRFACAKRTRSRGNTQFNGVVLFQIRNMANASIILYHKYC